MNAKVSPNIFLTLTIVMAIILSFLLYDDPVEEPLGSPLEDVEETLPPTPPEPPKPLSPPLQEAPGEPLYSERDIECLALNSYFEARNQSLAGRVAVAQVVLNRVESNSFPNTICEVIQQGPTYENWKGNTIPIRNQCHFSWWCDGKSDIPEDKETYNEIVKLVKQIINEKRVDITEGSLYYHADYVKPYWIDNLHQTLLIDNHIFYKHGE